MIEFTISRAALCICAACLLTVGLAVMDSAEDRNESEMCDDLAESIAAILDRFESSESTELRLRGYELIPLDGQIATVGGNIVSVTHGTSVSTAYTEYDGSFTLDRHSEVTLKKSVAEGLGDLPDGGDERIDLLLGVVDVRGGTGAPFDPTGHVERMGAVHT